MNSSRSKPSQAVSKGQTEADGGLDTSHHRDRKAGGGMLRKLKSRRSNTDKCPAVTEDELRALGRDISPDQVLGLRDVTEGINTLCVNVKPVELKAPLTGQHRELTVANAKWADTCQFQNHVNIYLSGEISTALFIV